MAFIASETLLVKESKENLENDDIGMSEGHVDQSSILPIFRTDINGSSASIPRTEDPMMRIQPAVSANEISAVKSASSSSGLCSGFRPCAIITILLVLLSTMYISAALMMVRTDRRYAEYLKEPPGSPERLTENRHF